VPDLPLACPRSLEDLYLERGDELAVSRPVLTGDVFSNVEIDADDHDGLVLVIAHPCSMRGARGRLRPRIAVAPIRPYQHLSFESWPAGHFNVFPLPQLLGDDDPPRAASLLELSSARSHELVRERRVAALTTRGVHLLQQRLVNSLTRVVVGLELLDEQSAHVLLEAELEEEWVDDLASDLTPDVVAAQSEAFAEFMDSGLRSRLLEKEARTDVMREVRREIRTRRERND
jgi:hypothetical protein